MCVRLSAILAAALAVFLGCSGAADNLRSDEQAAERRGRIELRRATQAEKRKQPAEAERHYRSALNLRPEHFKTHRRASLFFRGIGKADDAEQIARDYVERTPGDPRGYHLLAEIQFVRGDNKAAIDTLGELLTIDDEDAAALYQRGMIYMNDGSIEKSIADYRAAVQLKPKSSKYHTALGFALSRTSSGQSLEEASTHLRRAIELKKRNADANRLLGTVMRKRFEPQAALEYHLLAVEIDPASASAHFELGITHNALGQNSEAEASLKKALELEDDDPVTWYAYGEVLRITKQCSRAVPAYQRALELDRKHPKAANKLGVCYFATQNYKQAELILSAAVQVDPSDPYPYFNLAMVYDKLDRPNAAIKAYTKFVELAPSGDGDIGTAKKGILRLRRKIRRRY